MKTIITCFAFACLVATSVVQARIMDDDEASLADTSLLQTEASSFRNIRLGIALSFARCEGQVDCSPSVDSDEVKRLLNKLDSRINDLTLRQESVDDPVEYQQVLSLYVNERDNYSAILDRLGTVEEPVDLPSEPELQDTMAEEVPVVEEEPTEVIVEQADDLDFLKDSELDLEDDEDLDEFEDDFDPSQE